MVSVRVDSVIFCRFRLNARFQWHFYHHTIFVNWLHTFKPDFSRFCLASYTAMCLMIQLCVVCVSCARIMTKIWLSTQHIQTIYTWECFDVEKRGIKFWYLSCCNGLPQTTNHNLPVNRRAVTLTFFEAKLHINSDFEAKSMFLVPHTVQPHHATFIFSIKQRDRFFFDFMISFYANIVLVVFYFW